MADHVAATVLVDGIKKRLKLSTEGNPEEILRTSFPGASIEVLDVVDPRQPEPEPEPEPETEPETDTPFPANDWEGKDVLLANGITTKESVIAYIQANGDLTKIKGIGPASANATLVALGLK